jgi:hypothetical protein
MFFLCTRMLSGTAAGQRFQPFIDQSGISLAASILNGRNCEVQQKLRTRKLEVQPNGLHPDRAQYRKESVVRPYVNRSHANPVTQRSTQ